MSVVGAGYLLALDVLCDASYQLLEPIADTTITNVVDNGGGSYTLTLASMLSALGAQPVFYEGALIVVGYGSNGVEVSEITAVGTNTITVNTVIAHLVGEKVFGPTFPVRQPTDPLWTQTEMLAYLSTACNDFLTECPLVYQVNEDVTVPATLQNAPLPADCMTPQRIALQMPAGPYPMRETSQANLDTYDYRWQTNSADQPRAYFRDKVPLQSFGIWPRANNATEFEVVYSQRQAETMGLLDGFLFPDVFVPIVKYRVLSFAYSKDGEARNPGLAKFFAARYDFGVKVAKMVLEAINDPNLEMAEAS